MPLNFNVQPYYDDFDASKNFHRVLFKPGYAVQARELTQSQTILQDQITKFADNIFKQNSPVTGGQVTTNLNCNYIKLQRKDANDTEIDVSLFLGRSIKNADSTILAKVIAVAEYTTDEAGNVIDNDTLIVTYKTGRKFGNNETIYDSLSNITAKTTTSGSSGSSSVVSIAQGVFYISSNYTRSDGIKIFNGTFVQVNPQTIIISKYSKTPSARIGLNIIETINDYIDDPSLLDPANGASNYQAPGADRYVIKLLLETRPLELGNDDGFIELVRVTDGTMSKMVDGSAYAVIGDYVAKRDYETNGDYIINDFKLTPKINPNNDDTYILNVGPGLSYVHGYRVENPSDLPLISNKSRTTDSESNKQLFLDYGSYFFVDDIKGSSGSFFNISNAQTVDFHCVTTANTLNTNTYNSTLVGTGYIRSLTYSSSPVSDTLANTYIYKAHVHDILLSTISFSDVTINNGESQLTIPVGQSNKLSTTADAYVGVSVTINDGTSSFTNTILSYNSSTRVVTLKNAWSLSKATSTYTVYFNFGIKNIESIISVSKSSWPATITSSSKIHVSSKEGNLLSGDTKLINPDAPELIYPVGNPFVSNITDVSYQSFRTFNQSFNSGKTTITTNDTSSKHLGTDYLTSDYIKQNFIIIVKDRLTNTSIQNGDILSWTNSPTRRIKINETNTSAELTCSDLSDFDAIIIERLSITPSVTNDTKILKKKNLITANTVSVGLSGSTVNTYTHVDDIKGHIYIQKNGVVNYGNKQSLYLCDVKRIVKIIDTKTDTVPTVSMLSDSSFNVTNKYNFDNGQRDNFYDHASISLKPGVTKPTGNILVLVDYYSHIGGDGYFNALSYTTSFYPEVYKEIPSYTSKRGSVYPLRDCIDFRPSRKNAQTTFEYNYTVNNGGVLLPNDLSTYTCDYSYYLGRNDLLVVTKDKVIKVIEGTPSLSPTFPTQPTNSLLLARITHIPYTAYLPSEKTPSSLSISKVQHKRYTMQDIANLESRINQIEYYTSLSILEQSASSAQIKDGQNLNRFKNGIMTDDFATVATAEGRSRDFSASINTLKKQLSAGQYVSNFPLKCLSTIYNTSRNNLGFSVNSDGLINYYSLPYTTGIALKQSIASRLTNLNPFSVSLSEGILSLSPNSDTWVDRTTLPSLLIIDPDIKIWQSDPNADTVMETGEWKTTGVTTTLQSSTPHTTNQVISQRQNHTDQNWGYGVGIGVQTNLVTETITDVYKVTTHQSATEIRGAYSALGNTYDSNSGYITDVSIAPWIRQQEILIDCSSLLAHAPIHTFFDDTNVNNYVRKPNVIELENINGTFTKGNILAYLDGSTYRPIGVVIGVYNYTPSTLKTVRLYTVGELTNNNYNDGDVLYVVSINENNTITGHTSSGKIKSIVHNGGKVTSYDSNNYKITLSPKASSITNKYANWDICINSGQGIGKRATIVSYNSTTKVATLDSDINAGVNDVYTIFDPTDGTPFETNESGSFYGVFLVPNGMFHTGEKKFRIDNSINGNKDTATTSAESSFFAGGLSTRSQEIDFAASPSGARGTTSHQIYNDVITYDTQYRVSSYTYNSPYDPVAQTFMVDSSTYPNGVFLSSIDLFFSSKPATENLPVTLSIVGTTNGYPDGKTLDHSIVTVTKNHINESYEPHYLDSQTYTRFTFNVPVYIRPNVLYAFMVKSNSNEYNLWTASSGDNALPSSVKTNPSDATPTTITKISSAPGLGSLFISQNAQTWTADQNQNLMFTLNRCEFNTSVNPKIEFVVPRTLPQRTLVEDSVNYLIDPTLIADTSTTTHITTTNVIVDALNITTTDFVPTESTINYSYKSTLLSTNTIDDLLGKSFIPGRYGSALYDDIYLNDGKGERVFNRTSDTSISVFAELSSVDRFTSPMISDSGLSVFTIKNHINNCELSDSLITIVSGGTGYNAQSMSVTVSSPINGGSKAKASATVVDGVITSIHLTDVGSGYITTPTITISDPTTRSGNTDASVQILGETSSHGGPSFARYITKKVVLADGLDAGDLRVYLSAYRPVNTDIHVYYKILNKGDNSQLIDDSNWYIMTKINNCASLYSVTRNDLYEFEYAPGIFNSNTDQGYIEYSKDGQLYSDFNQFMIKIILTSTDATYTPFLTNMRCIALPPLTKTTTQ